MHQSRERQFTCWSGFDRILQAPLVAKAPYCEVSVRPGKRLVTKSSVNAGEKKYLSSVLVSNGYPCSFVQRITKPITAPRRGPVAEFKSTIVSPRAKDQSLPAPAYINNAFAPSSSPTRPFGHTIANRGSPLLTMVTVTATKGHHYHRLRIPCECDTVYIREQG